SCEGEPACCPISMYVLFKHSDLSISPSSSLFFNDPPPSQTYTLSLHDALPICCQSARVQSAQSRRARAVIQAGGGRSQPCRPPRSEEHTSELQSRRDLVCRLLLEKKKNTERNKLCMQADPLHDASGNYVRPLI